MTVFSVTNLLLNMSVNVNEQDVVIGGLTIASDPLNGS